MHGNPLVVAGTVSCITDQVLVSVVQMLMVDDLFTGYLYHGDRAQHYMRKVETRMIMRRCSKASHAASVQLIQLSILTKFVLVTI